MDVICVTQRSLCGDGFLEHIERVLAAKPKYLVLREKDLSAEEYECLARDVLKLCNRYNVPLICNSFYEVAGKIGAYGIQLPLSLARAGGYDRLNCLGISVHSVDEALEAQALGADYITYGHIFATDCKKGLAPRGVDALAEVCSAVEAPVYAIGGITPQNAPDVIASGARGVCLMSSLMTAQNPNELLKQFE
jgi:thiamine-phosphate pyrophosphorylase